jgi:hypothetical protein
VGDTGFVLLVAGLILETFAHHSMTAITDREQFRLVRQLDLTTKEAGEAKLTAALVESNNLILRSNIVVLERQVLEIRPESQLITDVSAELYLVARGAESTNVQRLVACTNEQIDAYIRFSNTNSVLDLRILRLSCNRESAYQVAFNSVQLSATLTPNFRDRWEPSGLHRIGGGIDITRLNAFPVSTINDIDAIFLRFSGLSNASTAGGNLAIKFNSTSRGFKFSVPNGTNQVLIPGTTNQVTKAFWN